MSLQQKVSRHRHKRWLEVYKKCRSFDSPREGCIGSRGVLTRRDAAGAPKRKGKENSESSTFDGEVERESRVQKMGTGHGEDATGGQSIVSSYSFFSLVFGREDVLG